jgi:hypothetical protein
METTVEANNAESTGDKIKNFLIRYVDKIRFLDNAE